MSFYLQRPMRDRFHLREYTARPSNEIVRGHSSTSRQRRDERDGKVLRRQLLTCSSGEAEGGGGGDGYTRLAPEPKSHLKQIAIHAINATRFL